MNGWEFARYLVDMVYQHWCVTAFFIFMFFPKYWVKKRDINIYWDKDSDAKLNINYQKGEE